MNLDTIIVESLVVFKTATSPKKMNVVPREHHSLSYRINGENILFSEDKKFTSNSHTLTLVPVGKSYSHEIVTSSEQIIAHFTTKESIGQDIEIFTLPLHCDMENKFYSLYHQWELEQKESNIKCMSIFYSILELISDNIKLNDNSKKNNLLYDSVTYMHAHYRESDFNISKLYEQAYISPAYYRRLFHDIYNCSPIEYLKNLRINYAKQLLSNGYYTISEIAELSGFSSSTYFSYEFKKKTGYTPMEYSR